MYDVILADPPWDFKTYSVKGLGRSPKYDKLSIEDICRLDVSTVANDNSVLFLWVTWPFLFHAKQVMEAWGFFYSTNAWVWVKLIKDGSRPRIGKGYTTRKSTEVCLYGRRGRIVVADRSVSDLICESWRKESGKPIQQYENIAKLFPGTKRLELFARNKYDFTWDVWGNEVECDIDIEFKDHL